MTKKKTETPLEGENKMVLLSEIIKNIEDEIAIFVDLEDEKSFNKICKDLRFIDYLPLSSKRAYLGVFIMRIGMMEIDLEDASNFAIELEKLSTLYLLLQPYTNIEIDVDDFSDEDYDTLMRSGFINKVMHFCGADYYKTQNLLSESYRIESIIKNYNASQELDLNKIEKTIESLKNMFSNLSSEDIQNLNSIITANDPIYGALKEYITTDTIK